MDQSSNIIADKALRISFYSFKVYLKNRIVGTYKELCEIANCHVCNIVKNAYLECLTKMPAHIGPLIAIIDLPMYQTLGSLIHFSLHLPTGKSSGLDSLSGESMKHAHPLLCFLVSICFTSMFKHCYMPQSMINSVIIPIIKNKSGDFTDKNNYRPIALSSIISKVFEHTIVIRLEEYLCTNDNQFGFKSGHSTDLCIYALSEFIEYFRSRSTSVYVAFIDASRAFDKISHWTLFKKLIDRHDHLYLVLILCYWYQHQKMTVRWGHCISISFNVTNGVRQGGVFLSNCVVR